MFDLSLHVQGTEIVNEALAMALQAAQQEVVTFSMEEMEQFNYEVWPSTEHTISQVGYIKGIPSPSQVKSDKRKTSHSPCDLHCFLVTICRLAFTNSFTNSLHRRSLRW